MLPLIYNAHCPKATGKGRDLVCSLGILQFNISLQKYKIQKVYTYITNKLQTRSRPFPVALGQCALYISGSIVSSSSVIPLPDLKMAL